MSRDQKKEYLEGLPTNSNGTNFSVLSYEFLKAAIESKELCANDLFSALFHFAFHAKDIIFDSSIPEDSEERTKDIDQKISKAIETINQVLGEICENELIHFKKAVTLIINEGTNSAIVAEKFGELGFKAICAELYPGSFPDVPEDLLSVIGTMNPAEDGEQ